MADGFRWWTVCGGCDEYCCWLKLGPVTVCRYRWFDERWRLSLCVFNRREVILFGGPL